MKTDFFNSFIKKDKEEKAVNNEVWIYTRVSSKDQESNNSLQVQKESTENYAIKNGLVITKWFGHTYESARGDFTRKEFRELINSIRKVKKKPYAILIYIMSRFSRSGGSGIGLVNEFMELGVHIIETQSGIGTQTDMGEFQINQKLLDARKENMDRLKSTIPGMKKFVENGNYLGNAPRGYKIYGPRTANYNNREPKQRMIINDEGKQMKKAWKWKVNGERDYIIIEKLARFGVIISKQTLSCIWRNPTYCGISTNKLLSKSIRGNWDRIVSEKDFIKVQQLLEKNKSGYSVNKTCENRPLTKHLICSKCGKPMSGYEVKKKRVHYYKCQTCKNATVNANTTKKSRHIGVHDTYVELLNKFKMPDDLIGLYSKQLKYTYANLNVEESENTDTMEKRLKELKKKDEVLVDKLISGTINDSVYENMKSKIDDEIKGILVELEKSNDKISNLENFVEKSISISQNISNYWSSGDYRTKIMIQDLLFPDGIVLNTEKRQYLTKNENLVFVCIEEIARETRGQKKDFSVKNTEKSDEVAGAGFEPTTFGL